MQAILSVLELWSVAWQGKPVSSALTIFCVFYIIKPCGTRAPNLLRVTATVLRLAEAASISLSATHVKSELNVLADVLSHSHTVLRNEWELAPISFRWICHNSPWACQR